MLTGVNPIPVITIDGAAGTGKGTIAKLLAKELDWHYLDSGALYRFLGYTALAQNTDLSNEQALVSLAATMQLEFIIDSAMDIHILLNKEDISQEIRKPDVCDAASKVSVFPAVRKALLARQHDFRKAPGLVTDGRDMGTIVFTDAIVKFYFEASADIRAERRYKQLKAQGIHVSLQNILRAIHERDQRDQERAVSPLKPADDAVVIVTTELGIDDVFAEVLQIVKAVL